MGESQQQLMTMEAQQTSLLLLLCLLEKQHPGELLKREMTMDHPCP